MEVATATSSLCWDSILFASFSSDFVAASFINVLIDSSFNCNDEFGSSKPDSPSTVIRVKLLLSKSSLPFLVKDPPDLVERNTTVLSPASSNANKAEVPSDGSYLYSYLLSLLSVITYLLPSPTGKRKRFVLLSSFLYVFVNATAIRYCPRPFGARLFYHIYLQIFQ